MELISNSFLNNDILPEEQVLNLHGCTGLNISPDLRWRGYPDETKEFALIMHDPDAPVSNGWYHWIVLKIPKEINSFEKGIKVKQPLIEANTTFSDVEGYGGACPPKGHGVHHYNFVIYALKEFLGEDVAKLPPFEIEQIVRLNSIASAQITALYQR